MRAIPQLVSAPLNPIPIAEHFRRSHPPFTIGESRAISHSNDTGQQAQVAGNPRFSTETALEKAD